MFDKNIKNDWINYYQLFIKLNITVANSLVISWSSTQCTL